MDSEYLRKEADRLTAISQGHRASSHRYPDVLTWTAPQTQADALVNDDGSPAVEGLGTRGAGGRVVGPIYAARQNFAWEWVRANFGQTLLIKRRPELKPLEAGNHVTPPTAPKERPTRGAAKTDGRIDDRTAPMPLDRGVKGR